ncbi:NmrA family NAD(P)-binding protein [Lichenifustis flavocetrariae]|uniref:NAD(P)H-binding protein n=1 Tax=Lichenifustis flavocetrariae TaxID=2949735 RepID=A0AA41Z0L6_9HYPH|nr:NAD(P)H-binding protein [Lichenifustis flavocetrariae]MCW6512014.1 NAD(P)H-binding protein [Lichenifustis flavocetrariae]
MRVIVRDAGKLPQAIRARAEIVEGSHGDAMVVDRAFKNAEAVFWVAPPTLSETQDDTYINFTRPAAEAIRRMSIPRVVVVTALGRGTEWEDRAGLVTASIRMVDLIRDTGAAVRGLAMPGFMENALQQVDAIKQGQMFGPLDPDRKLPHTATRDMGSASARLLQGRSWTGQEDVPLVGPQDLSFNDIAAILSDVLSREVRYHQVPFRRLQGAIDAARHERRVRKRLRRHDASKERRHGQCGGTNVRKHRADHVSPVGGGRTEARSELAVLKSTSTACKVAFGSTQRPWRAYRRGEQPVLRRKAVLKAVSDT